MAVSSDVLSMNTGDMTLAFATGTLSPVEVIGQVLQAAYRSRTTLNPFAALDERGAILAAQQSEERWRSGAPLSALDGVPVSIKDNIYAAGLPTRFGSLAIAAQDAEGPDSPAAARLREAGAVIFGKTTLPDFAHKIFTDSPLTGVTRNPWDLERTPGGSSGGAAAAVSAGIGPLALGSDGGGSVRVPAAWTGLFGFKPSFGRVPHHPRGAFAPLSHIGPMTRTVADAARVMLAIARPDPRDWYALPHVDTDYEAGLGAPQSGLRVAFSPQLGVDDLAVDPEVSEAVAGAARLFEQMGCGVDPADPPNIADCGEVSGLHWVAFAALLEARLGDRSRFLDPSLIALAQAGRDLPSGAMAEAYVRRGELGSAMNLFFEGYDLILAPVAPTAAPTLVEAAAGGVRPTLTSWCNLTGLPAASICCGFTRAGLPIGLQIIGPPRGDAEVLRASFAYEQARALGRPLTPPRP
jgi:aspartyl-tRNA(Asn)/glutamyl-tRNA(Gln) amidotransferase subunit A